MFTVGLVIIFSKVGNVCFACWLGIHYISIYGMISICKTNGLVLTNDSFEEQVNRLRYLRKKDQIVE